MKLMKEFILTGLTVFICSTLFSQTDGCSFAPSLPIISDCSSPVNGTSAGATQTIPGCVGNADDDVWYQFTATQTAHQIRVNPSAGYDPVVQLFSGPCSSLVSLGCKDDYATGVEEVINYANFTPGTVYRLRVYHYGAGWGTGDFSICVTTPPPPPSNDDCINAQPLIVNATCAPQTYTTDGASASLPGCAGNADDDVWFSFVATNAVQTIIASTNDNLDLVVQLFSGSCGNLTSLVCMDNTFTNGVEQIDAVGLTPGNTYYVRVYDYYTGTTGDFDICIVGTPTPTPTNDEPCDAILMPNVTASCNFASFTNVGATTTSGGGIPTPFSCVGGSGAAIGGFTSGTADVWFKVVVPASGALHITAQPNMGAGRISDGVMALYSGTCTSMSQIVCSDDHNYPGSNNEFLPMISEYGLTPGDTLFLRYWGFGTSTGTFGFCISTATNDDCVNALYICDINGYSASTGAFYTPDRPCNMHGNNETSAGVNQPDGINTGGIFGQGGSWGTGSPSIDVNIENNSWIKFTASATTALLQVSIYDCFVGNYPSGGIQMQIFAGSNCCDFVPVSNFEENSTGFTISANGLTVGNDYYLMVDGYNGDICNYTITAESGVQFPDIADVDPICFGQSVELVAPDDATSYFWPHSGETTQSVTVSPATTSTYVCEVTGLCDFKQTLDVEVEVLPLPEVVISAGASNEICIGESIQLTASGGVSYVWSSGQTTNPINVSPTTNTTYEVVATDANSCSNTASFDVVVNSLPTLSAAPTATVADCGLSNGALTGGVVTGTPTFTYSWTNSSSTVVGNQLDLTTISAGLYSLAVSDGNGCQASFGPFSVANPGAPDAPSIIASSDVTCIGESIEMTASSTTAGAVFEWSGPNGFTSSEATILIPADMLNQAGSYCVNATAANCTSPATCESITINELPVLIITANNENGEYCLGSAAELQVIGAQDYLWSGPNGFSSTGATLSLIDLQTSDAGYYVVQAADINGCANLDSIEIVVNDLPVITVSSDGGVSGVVCGGGQVTLIASGAENYQWQGPNGFESNLQNPVIVDFSVDDAGEYTVIGTDENGCANSASVSVGFGENNSVTILTEDVELCPGETLILQAEGAIEYSWTGPNDFSGQGETIAITNVNEAHTGIYYVIGTDDFGCSGVDSVQVTVAEFQDCLFIPELVTPNGDNSNDEWVITGIQSYPNAEISVFNRWGNLIFTASPYENNWYGQVNKGVNVGDGSGKVPPGTYFYIVDLKDGQTEPFKGYLELQY